MCFAGVYIRIFHAEEDDPAGFIAVVFDDYLLSVVVVVTAAVGENILQKAIDLKSENDPTIWAMPIIVKPGWWWLKEKCSERTFEKVDLTLSNLSILKPERQEPFDLVPGSDMQSSGLSARDILEFDTGKKKQQIAKDLLTILRKHF